MSHDWTVWMAAALTFCIFTFLYKDNPFYRFAEHVFVGVSSAWLLAVYGYSDVVEDFFMKVWPSWFHQSAKPDYTAIGGGIVAAMILLRLFGFTLISRIGVAFVIGFQTGQQLFSAIEEYLLKQIAATMVPLFVRGSWHATVRNWLTSLGTFSSLSYFYFTKEQKGWFGIITRIGIWFLMIGFGAAYGATVMTRMSTLIGRIYFLMVTWLGVVKT